MKQYKSKKIVFVLLGILYMLGNSDNAIAAVYSPPPPAAHTVAPKVAAAITNSATTGGGQVETSVQVPVDVPVAKVEPGGAGLQLQQGDPAGVNLSDTGGAAAGASGSSGTPTVP